MRLAVALWLCLLGTGCAAVNEGKSCAGRCGDSTGGEFAASPAPLRTTPHASAERAPLPEITAPPAAASTYDLSADLEARRSEVTAELGERAASELCEGVFLLAAPGGKHELSGPLAITRRALAAYFNNRFSKRPERAISVYLFANQSTYDAYCKKRWQRACTSPYGFYLGHERKIIMNVGPGIGTLTHELVHPLVESDFPAAPDWINEGIASLFERFLLPRPGEIHGAKNWRHPRLLQALNRRGERDLASLPALFALSDAEFRGDHEDLNYATARYFCQWMDQKGLLWAFYQRWRDNHDGDSSGVQAFTTVSGKSPAAANAEWVRWVRAL